MIVNHLKRWFLLQQTGIQILLFASDEHPIKMVVIVIRYLVKYATDTDLKTQNETCKLYSTRRFTFVPNFSARSIKEWAFFGRHYWLSYQASNIAESRPLLLPFKWEKGRALPFSDITVILFCFYWTIPFPSVAIWEDDDDFCTDSSSLLRECTSPLFCSTFA